MLLLMQKKTDNSDKWILRLSQNTKTKMLE